MEYQRYSMRIAIVNGPNLAHIGVREPHIYGANTWDNLWEALAESFDGIEFSYYQSNQEGSLIDYLYQASQQGVDGIVLNAGAYTHTSIALLDAIRAIPPPVIEVHLSNIYAREPYRHQSMIAAACVGSISGFGLDSYYLAVSALYRRMSRAKGTK